MISAQSLLTRSMRRFFGCVGAPPTTACSVSVSRAVLKKSSDEGPGTGKANGSGRVGGTSSANGSGTSADGGTAGGVPGSVGATGSVGVPGVVSVPGVVGVVSGVSSITGFVTPPPAMLSVGSSLLLDEHATNDVDARARIVSRKSLFASCTLFS